MAAVTLVTLRPVSGVGQIVTQVTLSPFIGVRARKRPIEGSPSLASLGDCRRGVWVAARVRPRSTGHDSRHQQGPSNAKGLRILRLTCRNVPTSRGFLGGAGEVMGT